MRTFTYNGHELKVYSSIDELPIINFQKYNKYLLVDSGIGSDVNDVDAHITKIARLIKNEKKAEAMQELQNMRQNMYMINSQISPKYMAFAALVYSLNGKDCKDLSDEGLQELLAKIRTVKSSFVTEILSWLKKKLESELETYFPEEFGPTAKQKTFQAKYQQLLALQKKQAEENKDYSREIEALYVELEEMYKPNCFNGKDSIEIILDKQFETACYLLAQKSPGLNPKDMTTLQYYSALSNMKRQIDIEAKALKKHKK